MRCEHCSNHQMQRTPSEPSANTPPSLYKVPTYSTRAGAAPRAPGGARHGGGNRAVNSQPRTGRSTLYGDVKSSYGGAGGWDRRGCATWAPSSATRQGEEQHRHTKRGSHTKGDKGGHTRQGREAQQGRRGNQNSGNREPEWSNGGACAWEAATKGMVWPANPVATGCQGNPCSTGIRWGRLPQPRWAVCATGAGAHQGQTTCEGEKDIWWTARTARGGTGHLGRTETQRGRLWTACGQRCVDSKNSQTTPATTSTSSIRQLLGAADTQTAHHATFSTVPTQQEHRPQRPTESSDPTQHAKGRTGDRPGPRKGATTRRNVTQGGGGGGGGSAGNRRRPHASGLPERVPTPYVSTTPIEMQDYKLDEPRSPRA